MRMISTMVVEAETSWTGRITNFVTGLATLATHQTLLSCLASRRIHRLLRLIQLNKVIDIRDLLMAMDCKYGLRIFRLCKHHHVLWIRTPTLF